MENEKCCATCKWWSLEPDHICMCEGGDKLSQYCDRSDDCEKWEPSYEQV